MQRNTGDIFDDQCKALSHDVECGRCGKVIRQGEPVANDATYGPVHATGCTEATMWLTVGRGAIELLFEHAHHGRRHRHGGLVAAPEAHAIAHRLAPHLLIG